jgi:curved DNA-binding protein CbpA
VRAAYRERVKEVHPDTEGGDEEAFKRVTRAYETLRERP